MKDCAKEERASEERETKEEGGRGKWRSHLAWRAVQPAAVASGKKHAAASNDRLILRVIIARRVTSSRALRVFNSHRARRDNSVAEGPSSVRSLVKTALTKRLH